jgi:translocation and assembly module TamB
VADEIASTEATPARDRRLRRDWARRLIDELLALVIALLVLLAAGLVLLDTAPGHRFIVDRIGQIETASGLRFHIGRIDGSIFGKSQLRYVTVSDQRGVFLTSPEIELDWSPAAWLYNSLHIDSLTAERMTLVRLPKLKPSKKRGRSFPSSTFMSASSGSIESTSGLRSAGGCIAGSSVARPTCVRAARW